jgi:tripartite-type tricarboxylate transporter receptor subunit TctC
MKRLFVIFAVATICAPFHVLAQSQFPSRAISIIIPAPPGGPTDVGGRIVAAAMSEILGQPIVPLNRPGHNTITGTAVVARADADGYTIGALVPGGVTSALTIGKDVPYNIDDLVPLGIVAFDYTVITTSASSQWKSVKQVMEYGKQNPKQLSYGSPGVGSPSQMGIEVLKLIYGVDITSVPYAGTGPVVTAVLGGHINLGATALSSTMSFIKSGRLLALAVNSPRRLPVLPDVPTITELGRSGTPNFWLGFFVTGKTPVATLNTLTKALGQVVTDSKTKSDLEKVGLIVDYRDPEAARVLIAEEMKAILELAKIVKLN